MKTPLKSFVASGLLISASLQAQEQTLTQELENKVIGTQEILNQSPNFALGHQYNLSQAIAQAQLVLNDLSSTDEEKSSAISNLEVELSSFTKKSSAVLRNFTFSGKNPSYYLTLGAEKAFDGDLESGYLYRGNDGCWIDLDLEEAQALTSFKVSQFLNFESHALGAVLQGSNDQTTYTDLFYLDSVERGENSYTVDSQDAYKYYRLFYPAGSLGATTELKFYTKQAQELTVVNSEVRLAQSATVVLTADQLTVEHDGLAPKYITFTVKSLPSNGLLTVDGQEASVDLSFTAQDILDKKIAFAADDTQVNSALSFSVEDALGASLTSQTLNFVIDSDLDGIDDQTELVNGTNPFAKEIPGLQEALAQNTNLEQGLTSSFYFNQNAFPNWSSVAPNQVFSTSEVSTKSIEIQKQDYYTAQFNGYIYIPADGEYNFGFLSDDRSELYIDGQKVIEDLRAHGTQERRGAVTLTKGFKEIRVDYLELAGNIRLDFYWNTPLNIATVPVDPSYLFRSKTGHQARLDSADLDGDKLTDKKERELGTDINNADTDGDGILDGDAVAQGLDPLSGNADTDLVNDYDELNLYQSNPLKADITGFTEIAKISGASISASEGQWQKVGSDFIINTGRRGWVEYKINVPKLDAYRLDLFLKQHLEVSRYNIQDLAISVDGEFVKRITATLSSTEQNKETLVTPVLTAGEHTVRIYRDNVYHSTQLQIHELSVQTIDGPDSDNSGQKDWFEYRLDKMNSLNDLLNSKVSPLTIEGSSRYLKGLNLTVANQNALVKRAGKNQFYTNVNLDASKAVNVKASYENGAKLEEKSINWEVTNLFVDNEISLRQGDSLLLNAVPEGLSTGSAVITYNSQAINVSPEQNQVVSFDTAGTQNLTATYTAVDGSTQSASLTVKVIAKPDLTVPWLIKDQERDWIVTLTEGVELSSTGLNLTQVADDKFRLKRTEVEEDIAVVAKVAGTNQILESVETKAFTVRDGVHGYVVVVKEFEDGSGVAVDTAFAYNVPDDIQIKVIMTASGVTFKDGTRERILTKSDLSSLGTYLLEFYKDNTRFGASCHVIYVYQDGQFVGRATR